MAARASRRLLMPDFVGWFLDPANWSGFDGLPTRVLEHLEISGTAILAALLIALPVGLWVGHTGRGAILVVNLANTGRAIPSYALLGMLLPVTLALDPVNGLYTYPTFLAMTVLAIPPILVNAYAGLREVDRELIEAARGMGFRERQLLVRIEAPLAMPVIVGGIRTATLQVIATATIGAIVGGPGLGRYIIDGLALQDYARVVAGAITIAVLAVGVDQLLALAQRALTPRSLRGGSLAPAPVPGQPSGPRSGWLVETAE